VKMMQSNAQLNLYNSNHHKRVWDIPLSGYCSPIKLTIVEHEWHSLNLAPLSDCRSSNFHCSRQLASFGGCAALVAESEKSEIINHMIYGS